MEGSATLPLDPIHDALEKLRFRAQVEEHRLASLANGATAEWKSIYTALLKRVSVSTSDPKPLLDLLRTIRNTIHNNGVYLSPKGVDLTITYKGNTFQFTHGKGSAVRKLAVASATRRGCLRFTYLRR